MNIVTIKNNNEPAYAFTPEDIFDKQMVKKDLMEIYKKDELKADIWILYNYDVLKELVANELLHKVFENEFSSFSIYEENLEFLMTNSLQ